MKILAYSCLALVFAMCIGIGARVLFQAPWNNETSSTLTALLAVIAAIIGVLPALRVLQVQEDTQRPRPTPYFDLTSRYDLLQLRIKNVGASVAYDIRLSWKAPLPDDEKGRAKSLDRTAVLLPQESVSTLLGEAREMVKKFADNRFEGECSFKDASGKKYKEVFVCSVEGSQRQLLHDSELPKTLHELQKIPESLDEITEQLKELTSQPEPPSQEAVEEIIERARKAGRL